MKKNIVIDQGADFQLDIPIKLGTSFMDLTDYTVAAQMRTYYDSTDATSFDAEIPEPANNGIIRISLNNATTDNLKAGRYLYDIEITDANSKKTRVVEGIATVTPSITKV